MDFADLLHRVIGPDGRVEDLTWYHVVIRAALVYMIGLVLVRVGKERFIGKSAVFDAFLGFILGSVLSRAINGPAPFLDTIAGTMGLVFMHGLFARIAYRSHGFGNLIKGVQTVLVRDGKIDEEGCRKFTITEHDLKQALRLHGMTDISEIGLASFERNGEISIVPRSKSPRIIEIEVRDGVQRIRLEID